MNTADKQDVVMEGGNAPIPKQRRSASSHHHPSSGMALEMMIRANQHISFINGMTSHDINNKRTVLAGYIDLARGMCEDPAIQTILGNLRPGLQVHPLLLSTTLHNVLLLWKPRYFLPKYDVCKLFRHGL
jgi:hypothetical protein